MNAILTTRCHQLADSLAERKGKVRTVLASELATAIGTAVRDVLVVSLVDPWIAPTRPTPTRTPFSRPASWRGETEREWDEWGYSRDLWDEPDNSCDQVPVGYACDETEDGGPRPVIPAMAAVVVGAVVVGVNVGRWWLARKGTVAAAIGLGVLTTGLGLAGGPVARAALAVLAATADVLVAERALARSAPS